MKKTITLLITMVSSLQLLAQTGPGGVGTIDGTSTLVYWIDANNGVTNASPITDISDLSGNGIINIINGDPQLITSVMNGMSVVRFDGTGDEILTNVSINAIDNPNLTILSVYIPRIDLAGSVWGEDNGQWDRYQTDVAIASPRIEDSVGAGIDPINGAHPANGIPGLFPPATPVFSSVIYQEDVVNGTTVRVNANLAATFTSNADPYTGAFPAFSDLYIGAIGSNGFQFDGDIAEVIVFNNNLNSAQEIIIENYLSAKYGIAIANLNADVYDEDDSGFDFEVAGIGRIDASNIHNDAQSSIVRILNATNLDDGEFFMWGHDGGNILAVNVSDLPAGVEARSDRLWRASEEDMTGSSVDVGSMDIRFDLTNFGPVTSADLRLIIDTDDDGVFTDETAIAGATFIGGDVYEFAAVTDITDNLRFTFGTSDAAQTPLPIDLVNFEVTPLISQVKLSWETMSEFNNDYFTIEKSTNAYFWKEIQQVAGNGTSTVRNVYNATDMSPSSGTSYYRLKQTDFDGKTEVFDVVSVNAPVLDELMVYPNPTSDIVHISRMAKGTIMVKNMNGKIVKKLDSTKSIDLSSLPSGLYVLHIEQGNRTVLRLIAKD